MPPFLQRDLTAQVAISTPAHEWVLCGRDKGRCTLPHRTTDCQNDQMFTEGTVEISGGRRLDYCAWGERGAPAAVYCHGTPGSRWELLLARPMLERHGVNAHLVGINRAGYGASTFVARREFLATARDIEDATERLGIRRFAVLGASGGSPFALACAQLLPDRVSRVAIVAGVAPPDTPGMEDSATIAAESPSSIVRSLRYGTLAVAVRAGFSARLVRRLVESLGPADRRAMAQPDQMTVFGHIVHEAFAQWGRAAAQESGLFLEPWGFDPTQVTQEIRIWHGGEDNRIPGRVAIAFADRLPNTTSVVWPHHGHFSWAMSDEVADVAGYLAGSPSPI